MSDQMPYNVFLEARMTEIARQRGHVAHAQTAYLCECGKLVHGNGAKAMHFYVKGRRAEGYRPGHRIVSTD